MIIKIRKYSWWKVAASRKSAINIIKKENIDYNNQDIIFDFKKIETITHGFIDELVWPYIEEIWKVPTNIKFQNCNDYITKKIKFAINHRLSKNN